MIPATPQWMSRSYPYLSIAHRFKLDYGVVLIYSSLLSIADRSLNNLERDAVAVVSAHPERERIQSACALARELWQVAQQYGMMAVTGG